MLRNEEIEKILVVFFGGLYICFVAAMILLFLAAAGVCSTEQSTFIYSVLSM
ncbi:MAG: hypothetical protein ACI4C1_07920 [Lachnospiraceae bacterium]